MSSRIGVFTAALLLVFAISLTAQTGGSAQATTSAKPAATKPEIQKVPAAYTDPASGRQMFDSYCAACHGQGGKGNGPAAAALKTPPADLTQLAAKNGGKFPEAHVAQIIKGDALTPAHGSKDMPVWGPIFSNMSKQNEAVVQLRIRNLTNYIAGLQAK